MNLGKFFKETLMVKRKFLKKIKKLNGFSDRILQNMIFKGLFTRSDLKGVTIYVISHLNTLYDLI